MTNLSELIAQRDALNTQIAAAMEASRRAAIEEIRSLMADFNLTPEDVAVGKSVRRKQSSPVAAKYRNPATGQTWTGRGRAPTWVRGDKSQDLIG